MGQRISLQVDDYNLTQKERWETNTNLLLNETPLKRAQEVIPLDKLLHKTQWSTKDVIVRLIYKPHQSNTPDVVLLQNCQESKVDVSNVKLTFLYPAFGGTDDDKQKAQGNDTQPMGTLRVADVDFVLSEFSNGPVRVAKELTNEWVSIADDMQQFNQAYGCNVFTFDNVPFQQQTQLKADVEKIRLRMKQFEAKYDIGFKELLIDVANEMDSSTDEPDTNEMNKA